MPRVKKNKDEKLTLSLEPKGFYSDFERPKTLYAALIRSPTSSGKIKNITIKNLPEDCFFYTADDIPQKKYMELNKSKTKIFGYGNIGYSGEPLGIIIGPNEQIVDELLEDVSVNLDVESLESALKNVINNQRKTILELKNTSDVSNFVEEINDLPSLDTVVDKSLKEEDSNQIVATREIKTGLYKTENESSADKQLFENADFISEETWSQKLINPNNQETAGAFCYTEGEKLHIYVATKWTYEVQKAISETLNLDPKFIIIHKTKSTGFYQYGLWRTTQIAVQTALAAYLSKKPVKLVLSPSEQEKFEEPGTNIKFHYKTATNSNGQISAMKINIDIDIGFENPFAQEITDRITICSVNYYKIKNLCIHTVTHKSKNPPTSISLKNVDSQAFFSIENQIQKICSETNILPYEIRIKNSTNWKDSDFPFIINVFEIENTILQTIKISDFNRKYASFHMEVASRVEKDATPFFALPLRGIGISNAYTGAGYLGTSNFSYDSKVEVTLTKDEKIIIHTIKPSEVIQDIWKKTASEIFKLPKQNIQIDSVFDYDSLPKTPEDSFITIGIINELIRKCCNDIQKRRFHQPLPLSCKKSVSPTLKKGWNKETFSGNPFSSISFASIAVEVELDPYTYNEKIKGVWVTVNCGELFDKEAALKTIRLEIQHELSMLVKEKNVHCDNVSINFIETKNKSGQIGGLIHNTLPAAFSSALSQALATQLTSLPCTEEQLFTLIKERRMLKNNETQTIDEENKK